MIIRSIFCSDCGLYFYLGDFVVFFQTILKLFFTLKYLSSKMVWFLIKFLISFSTKSFKSRLVFFEDFVLFFDYPHILCLWVLIFTLACCEPWYAHMSKVSLMQSNMCFRINLDWFPRDLVESASLWWSDKKFSLNQIRVF